MPRVRIDNLGQSGLITDIHPTQLPPNILSTLENAICEEGSVEHCGGERKLIDIAIKPKYHYVYTPPQGDETFFIVSDGYELYAYALNGLYVDLLEGQPNPSASGGAITFTTLNGILVINSTTDGAWYVDVDRTISPGIWINPLPDWGTDWRCTRLVAYKYYLVALGAFIGTGATVKQRFPFYVRWSASADPGSIPTKWEILAANDAGDNQLSDTDGKIITAIHVGNSLWIVKEDAIYAMNWVGGQYIFQFTKLTGNIGSRLIHGAVEFGNGIALLGMDDIYFFDGSSIKSLVTNKIKKRLFNLVGPDKWRNAQITSCYNRSRLLVAAPRAAGDDTLYDMLILNSYDQAWSHKLLYTCYGFDESFIKPLPGEPESNVQWDAKVGTWDSTLEGSWNKGSYDPYEKQLVLYKVNPLNTSQYWIEVWHNTLYTDSNGEPIESTVGRKGITFTTGDHVFMVKDVWIELTGSIDQAEIYFGMQSAMDGVTQFTGKFTIKPNETIKVSPRITGRFLSWFLEVKVVGTWQLSALTFDYELAGER